MEKEYKYYCNECGSITEGVPYYERLCEDPNGWDEFVRCECGSDDIEAAAECPICSEWHKEELYTDLCPDCFKEITSDYMDTFSNIAEAYPFADPDDILEGMAASFEKFYDDLFRRLTNERIKTDTA